MIFRFSQIRPRRIIDRFRTKGAAIRLLEVHFADHPVLPAGLQFGRAELPHGEHRLPAGLRQRPLVRGRSS